MTYAYENYSALSFALGEIPSLLLFYPLPSFFVYEHKG